MKVHLSSSSLVVRVKIVLVKLEKRIDDFQEKELLYQFLMGLDSDFNVIKTQILATKPTPNLGTAYHLVAKDER